MEVHVSPKIVEEDTLEESKTETKDLTTILETSSEDLHEGGESEEVKVSAESSPVQ